MSQSDYLIADDNFPNYHVDLNLVVKALASMNEGATAPATTYASMIWVNTTANILKLRNKANTAWISVADIDYANDRMQFIANIFTAASTAGYTFKASGGGTLLTVSNTGLLTTGSGGIDLGGRLDANGEQVILSKGADVASATTLTLGTDGNYFDITGTTTITGIATLGVGAEITLHFDAAVQLTHHATNLIIPGAANYTTAAGDEFTFKEYATADWRCVSYTLASGESITTSQSGLTKISSATITGSPATIEFTGFVDATRYVDYVFRFSHAEISVATEIRARTSSDGGATWDAATGDYGSGSAAQIILTGTNPGIIADTGICGHVTLHSPDETNKTYVSSDLVHIDNADGPVKESKMGYRDAAADVDGIQFLFQAGIGLWTGGEITVYGVGISV